MKNQSNPAGFVNSVISRIKTDTAFRAAMSRADNPAFESGAWEHLIGYCNIEFEAERLSFAFIGAAIARNRPDADCADIGFGQTFRSICSNDDDKEREMRRFRRLIACDTIHELLPILRPILNYLASKGAKIGYAKLLNDLLCWNQKIALTWTVQFIHKVSATEGEEA